VYGSGVAYENFITGDNSELNAALTLLIDDDDLEKTGRSRLTSDSLVYMSLSTATSNTFGKITDVLFSVEYTTSESYAVCEPDEEDEKTTTFSLAGAVNLPIGLATIALITFLA